MQHRTDLFLPTLGLVLAFAGCNLSDEDVDARVPDQRTADAPTDSDDGDPTSLPDVEPGDDGSPADTTVEDAALEDIVPPGPGACAEAAIAVENGQACAIDCAGALWCWGRACDALGPDLCGVRLRPERLAPESAFATVDLSPDVAMAIDRDGRLWKWGTLDPLHWYTLYGGPHASRDAVGWQRLALEQSDFHFNLAGMAIHDDGSLQRFDAFDAVPRGQVGERTDWVDLALGNDHWCAVNAARELWCGGSNDRGQLAHPDTGEHEARRVPGNWAAVVAAPGSTCGLSQAGALWCWGDFTAKHWAELGGNGAPWTTPRLIGTEQWRTVSLGANDLVGIAWEGTLVSVLEGDLTTSGPAAPWVAVDTSDSALCAIDEAGLPWCRAIGDRYGVAGHTANRWVPTPIDGPEGAWDLVSPGYQSTCASLESRISVACWGRRGPGQTRFDGLEALPQPPERPVELANGYGARCIVGTSGRLWCIGEPESPLGFRSDAWALVDDGTDWSGIAVGLRWVCGLRSGQLWCLDDATSGASQPRPEDWWLEVRVSLDASPETIVEPYGRALREDGTVWDLTPSGPLQVGDMAGVVRLTDSDRVIGVDHIYTSWPDSEGVVDWHITWPACASAFGERKRPSGLIACWICENELSCEGGRTPANEPSAEPLTGNGYPPESQVIEPNGWLWFEFGHDHVCAQREDGQYFCWGNGGWDQVLWRATPRDLAPVRLLGP